MNRLGVVAIACAVSACAGAPTLRDNAARAKTEGKTVIVEFYADWCTVCKQFDRTVYRDARVQAALRDVRYVKLDAERGRGRIEAKRLGVAGYPTFVALDPSGEPVAVLRGIASVDYFVKFVEWGQIKAWDEAMMTDRLARDRSPASLRLAGRWNVEAGRRDDALALYDEALAARPDADLQWERAQVASTGGSREAWAAAAAEYLAENPRDAHSLDALRIALLSGGLDDDAMLAVVAAYVTAVADDAARLEHSVYILMAAGMYPQADDAAVRLVERWPKLRQFRDTLAVVRERRFRNERVAAHRDWVARRIADLHIK
jgi:thiol-disulfide isomerase/thioredoxin